MNGVHDGGDGCDHNGADDGDGGAGESDCEHADDDGGGGGDDGGGDDDE